MKKINLYGYEAKEYNICVGENAVPNEIFSAKELCKYLGICTCKISTEVIKPCFVIGFGAKGNEASSLLRSTESSLSRWMKKHPIPCANGPEYYMASFLVCRLLTKRL